jgi:Fic family protein
MSNSNNLLDRLKEEMNSGMKGGIYHLTQIKLCYNSNRIEGSKLTEDQTRYIYETNTIAVSSAAIADVAKDETINVDDIIETVNHFSCFRFLLKTIDATLDEKMIKQFHSILKTGTSDSQKEWFNVGEYKKLENIVGGKETTLAENVSAEMKQLLEQYHTKEKHDVYDVIDFHYAFESIHPFQDGNGRVGRLILFRECLINNIVPFIIEDDHKLFYYRGLKEYDKEKGFLRDTCLSAQDIYKTYLDYFKIRCDMKRT